MPDSIPILTIGSPNPTPLGNTTIPTLTIIGNAAVTQAATPGGLAPPQTPPVAQNTTATTVPQLSLNGPTVPPAPGTVGAQSFLTNLSNGMQPNPLNLYWQPTYHFRLFMVNDEFKPSQVPITQLLNQINTNAIRQVIIAETGITGYNIKSVEINTINANNHLTHAQKATVFSMVITETMGLSFLDALWAGATYLKIFDYTKAHYFLLLSFTGYNSDDPSCTGPDGSDAGNPISSRRPLSAAGSGYGCSTCDTSISRSMKAPRSIRWISISLRRCLCCMRKDSSAP